MSDEPDKRHETRITIASLGGVASLLMLFWFLPSMDHAIPSNLQIITNAVIFSLGLGLAVGCIRHSGHPVLIIVGAFSLSLYLLLLFFILRDAVDRLDSIRRYWRTIFSN